jgi:flavin-dependent dehydrogenase
MGVDVAIVGGGPAGLATAIHCAQRGLSCVVLERRSGELDKACGEGLLPAGVVALEALGVRSALSSTEAMPLAALRYVQEDGSSARARLPVPGGLGIRRTVLMRALRQRAEQLGVSLRTGVRVDHHERTAEGIRVEGEGFSLRAGLLVAADGLASPIRAREGLDVAVNAVRRFGVRQHFDCAPWSDEVEVHLTAGIEAYVTPVGPACLGVAFLSSLDPLDFDAMWKRFPRLARRLEGSARASSLRGAGPLQRRARAVTAERLALVGDAGGYVDAITGEGLSLAFECAEALAVTLPSALASSASRASLAPYERAFRTAFRRYAWTTQAMLALAARPALRRRVVRMLAATPALFEGLVASVVSPRPSYPKRTRLGRSSIAPSPFTASVKAAASDQDSRFTSITSPFAPRSSTDGPEQVRALGSATAVQKTEPSSAVMPSEAGPSSRSRSS